MLKGQNIRILRATNMTINMLVAMTINSRRDMRLLT